MFATSLCCTCEARVASLVRSECVIKYRRQFHSLHQTCFVQGIGLLYSCSKFSHQMLSNIPLSRSDSPCRCAITLSFHAAGPSTSVHKPTKDGAQYTNQQDISSPATPPSSFPIVEASPRASQGTSAEQDGHDIYQTGQVLSPPHARQGQKVLLAPHPTPLPLSFTTTATTLQTYSWYSHSSILEPYIPKTLV
jgi:hypothetical protein